MSKIWTTITAILLIVIIGGSVLLNFNNNTEKNLIEIKVAEVTHSIFYAPQYVALTQGYFEEEGLNVELVLTPGADKVTAAVLSNDVQIGFAGSEATIYIYNEGEKDYLQTFAQLTQKDGSFIVSKEPNEEFTLEDLKGQKVIAGRPGGMPVMTFEWVLKENGINPETDLIVDTSIDFASMSGAFISGEGDYVNLFEPTALQIEEEGYGHVVASLGELGGNVPYTTYQARKSYIEDNPEIIEKFNRAIQKGIDFVYSHTDLEVAEAISTEFPDITINDIAKVVERYRGIEAWAIDTTLTKESFDHLQDIMESSSVLTQRVEYEELVHIPE